MDIEQYSTILNTINSNAQTQYDFSVNILVLSLMFDIVSKKKQIREHHPSKEITYLVIHVYVQSTSIKYVKSFFLTPIIPP